VEQEVLLDSENMNYSQLREIQRSQLKSHMHQASVTSLAQQDHSDIESTSMVQTQSQSNSQGRAHTS